MLENILTINELYYGNFPSSVMLMVNQYYKKYIVLHVVKKSNYKTEQQCQLLTFYKNTV